MPMTSWTSDELAKIGTAESCRLRRSDKMDHCESPERFGSSGLETTSTFDPFTEAPPTGSGVFRHATKVGSGLVGSRKMLLSWRMTPISTTRLMRHTARSTAAMPPTSSTVLLVQRRDPRPSNSYHVQQALSSFVAYGL